jgi:hypothetical protein
LTASFYLLFDLQDFHHHIIMDAALLAAVAFDTYQQRIKAKGTVEKAVFVEYYSSSNFE